MGCVNRLLALTFLTLIWLHAGVAAGQAGLVDFIIDNPTTSQAIFPWGSGRMASLGGLSGFMYRTESFQDWFYLQDSFGNESHIPLPDSFSKNERANAEYILTAPDQLWVWSGVFGTSTLRHYRLEGRSPLPSRATQVSATPIGDKNSRPAGLIRLANGGFLGIWYQFEYHADRHIEIGAIYGQPDGSLQVYFPLQVPGTEGNIIGTRFTLAQHPADGSIWVFFKRDSYHEISAVHLSETDTGLKVNWVQTDFISHRDGIHAPESEFPYLVAAQDLQRKTLRLAYQNSNFEMFYIADKKGTYVKGLCPPPVKGKLDPAFFSKGANISLVEIGKDRSRSFLLFPEYADATRYFGFSVSRGLWLAYQPINCALTTYDSLQRRGEVYLSHFDGAWSKPALMGRWNENKEYYASPILFNARKPEFVMRLDHGKVYNFLGF